MIPVIVFTLQVFFAAFRKSNDARMTKQNKQNPSVTVLMPAHNESLVIKSSIESIQQQLGPNDSLLVVADNCSDNTAEIARKLGANVLERADLNQRGKGYALDFGLQHLKIENATEIVLIVDADCIIQENALSKLALLCWQTEHPVQALYLMEQQTSPSLKEQIAMFAWVVKNKVRPLGSRALGFPCQLMGTGMAFLQSDLLNINLASGHIVEDMKLGVDLARMNKAPIFMHDAIVTSRFPVSGSAVETQRTRWEHGHLSVIVSEAPKLFFEAIKKKNFAMFGLACDLIVPPLALLIMLCLIALVFSLLLNEAWLIVFASSLLLALSVSVLLAWYQFGQSYISFKQLCYAPVYALLKIPLYIKFFLNRQVDWIRSKRD